MIDVWRSCRSNLARRHFDPTPNLEPSVCLVHLHEDELFRLDAFAVRQTGIIPILDGGIHDAMNLTEKLLAILREGESESLLDRYERQRRTIAIDYINASTARNKRDIEERDPIKRKENQQALRELSLDSVRARAYIRQSSMLDALERAKAIA